MIFTISSVIIQMPFIFFYLFMFGVAGCGVCDF
nr:MAG TPA: hypothetical protein [Caudoviricetes sp.]